MKIEEQRRGAVTVARAVGSLSGDDAVTFTTRSEAMIAKSLGRFLVDASEITFVDSKGLEGLVALADRLAETGQVLKLTGAGETMREVLELTGIAPRFEHYDDVNTAVRSFL